MHTCSYLRFALLTKLGLCIKKQVNAIASIHYVPLIQIWIPLAAGYSIHPSPQSHFSSGGILRRSQTSKGRCLGDILTSAQVTSTSSLQHAGESAPRSQSLSPTSLRPQKQWKSPTVLEKRRCLKQGSSSILKSYWTSRLVQHQQYCRYCIELSRWREHQVERLRHTNPSTSQLSWNLGNDQKVANSCSWNDSMVAGFILRERVRAQMTGGIVWSRAAAPAYRKKTINAILLLTPWITA